VKGFGQAIEHGLLLALGNVHIQFAFRAGHAPLVTRLGRAR
jgi:hypothetical protein